MQNVKAVVLGFCLRTANENLLSCTNFEVSK